MKICTFLPLPPCSPSTPGEIRKFRIIEIGRSLDEAKDRLKHGKFGDWLKAEFEWTVRTAQQFMRVAEVFKYENFSYLNIAPSALYLIAATSTPEEIREAALEKARSGERVDFCQPILKSLVAAIQAHQSFQGI